MKETLSLRVFGKKNATIVVIDYFDLVHENYHQASNTFIAQAQ